MKTSLQLIASLTWHRVDSSECPMLAWEVSIVSAIPQIRIERRWRSIHRQECGVSSERNHSCLWVPEASLTCLNVILARWQECVPWPQKLEVWVCKRIQCSSMQTCWMRSLEKAHHLPSRCTWNKTRQSGPRRSWRTDAWDVYGNVSTEKGGLPQQKALTLEIATIPEWLVNSEALIRRTADEKHDHEWSDEGSQKSQDNTWLEFKETPRWFVKNRRLNQSVHVARHLSRPKRVQVQKSCVTSPMLWRLDGSSLFWELSWPFIFLLWLRALRVFNALFLNSEVCTLDVFFLKRSTSCR